MRHAEQRQQIDEQRDPHDAAAHSEQTGDETRPEADQRKHADPLHHSIHQAPLVMTPVPRARVRRFARRQRL